MDREEIHDELKRREDALEDEGDVTPANDTLNAIYGALIQDAIESFDGIAVLEDDNANNELEAEVKDEEHTKERARDIATRSYRSSVAVMHGFSPEDRHDHEGRIIRSWNDTSEASWRPRVSGAPTGSAPPATLHSNSRPSFVPFASGTVSSTSYRPTGAANNTNPGTSWSLGSAIFSSELSNTLFSNSPNRTNAQIKDSIGTVIANRTHVLLGDKQVVSKVDIIKLIVPDLIARVFHPTQGGHALIANLILYRMAANAAKAQGTISPYSYLLVYGAKSLTCDRSCIPGRGSQYY